MGAVEREWALLLMRLVCSRTTLALHHSVTQFVTGWQLKPPLPAQKG